MNEQSQINDPSEHLINWRAIGIYYTIACSVSWPFLIWRDFFNESWQQIPLPYFFRTSLYMWGPGLAALIMLFAFRRRHQRTVTVFGTSTWRSLVFFLVPMGVWATVSGFDAEQTVRGMLIFVPIAFFNYMGEELGWRGYLQDALRPLPTVRRFLLIGLLWEFWHFPGRFVLQYEGATLLDQVGSLAGGLIIVVIAAFLTGLAVERSRSLLVAITLHAWLNNAWEFPFPASWISWGVFIPILFLMLYFWRPDGRETDASLPESKLAPQLKS